MRALRLTLLLCSVAGCGSGGGDAPCTTDVSMQVVQAQVFDGCATGAGGGCHQAAPFGANLNLTSGQAYGYLLHAPSSSSPGKWRVEPGDLASSFLWHKLTNTIATDASEGVPMPRDSSDRWAPLTSAQLAAVRCWITGGAPNQ